MIGPKGRESGGVAGLRCHPLAGLAVELSIFAWDDRPLASGIWWPGLAALVAMSSPILLSPSSASNKMTEAEGWSVTTQLGSTRCAAGNRRTVQDEADDSDAASPSQELHTT
jgi:hypothetical protein